MAKYTIELRKIANIYGSNEVKSWFSSYELTDYLTQKEIDVITNHNTWTKEKLASTIFYTFYTREIGYETPALFRHYAIARMNIIMEKYLPLIYTASLEYDLLTNENYKETFTRNYNNKRDVVGQNDREETKGLTGVTIQDGTSNVIDKANQNASGLTINSDTPQGQISKVTILNGTYASSTSAGESEQQTTNNTDTTTKQTTNNNQNENLTGSDKNKVNENGSGDESYTRHFEGNHGIMSTYQNLIKQYRENIIAINEQIINELKDLFIGLY